MAIASFGQSSQSILYILDTSSTFHYYTIIMHSFIRTHTSVQFGYLYSLHMKINKMIKFCAEYKNITLYVIWYSLLCDYNIYVCNEYAVVFYCIHIILVFNIHNIIQLKNCCVINQSSAPSDECYSNGQSFKYSIVLCLIFGTK